ncbi:hypothetical protein GCM10023170_091530 [Phytohabitans houttuyneae]|uniref:Uncharacterized protein n=1 Tax=Phytohabitans houttuyneae TaxID=1076126 RepID=A0A6V8KV82_9ACTN|nr:hypothetical protein Phou_086650 [Phytohabitans houttuyneae]
MELHRHWNRCTIDDPFATAACAAGAVATVTAVSRSNGMVAAAAQLVAALLRSVTAHSRVGGIGTFCYACKNFRTLSQQTSNIDAHL